MRFCTAVNCMDGRVQLPVIRYLQQRFRAEYVDSITEPGPNLILATQQHEGLVRSILARVRVSIERHASRGLAVAGHYGCLGNPARQKDQARHTRQACRFLRQQFKDIEIIGLWVGEDRAVHEIHTTPPADRIE